MGKEVLDNAKKNAKKDCPKCHGTGSYMYSENHLTVCDLCCFHNMGWCKLTKHHGEVNVGKWCCLAGCGKIVEFEELSLQDLGCTWPDCKCQVPHYAFSQENRRSYCHVYKNTILNDKTDNINKGR